MKAKGFTLVEIAIVLVIIGILIAAVLKGQELITQGKIKGVISDFNGVTTAYNGYQDRFRAIPGDDPGAGRWTTTGPPALTVNHGNGDGIVVGNYDATPSNPPTALQESNNFWRDLRLANFYPGSTSDATGGIQPTDAVGGIIGVQNAVMGMTGISICLTGVPFNIALAVDTQIDDGHAATGSVRAIPYAAGVVPTGADIVAAPAADYADGNTYVLCRQAP